MTKGRKMLPTNVKQAKGTLQKCRTNALEPKFAIVKDLPDPPKYFDNYARGIYLSTGLELVNNGILTNTNYPIFLVYVTELMEYRNACVEISKGRVAETDKGMIVSPYLRIRKEALQGIFRAACEFGLTPASSAKVNAIKQETNLGDEFFK